ncbi:MAG: hypothetical protein U1F71_22280 [Verrucomicrobiaceae bacterium]
MKRLMIAGMIFGGVMSVVAQQGDVLVSFESIEAAQKAEQEAFLARKQALQQQPPSPQRDAQLREEVLRHQGEAKRLSVQQQAARKDVISDLKQKWEKVESGWKNECARHDAATKQLETMPEGPAKTAAIEAENATHRSTSKQLAAERNVVHEGVMQQANREVMGGTTNASNSVKQTAGTSITDPNHRGMNGDFDAGGGYRTTEKAGKILNEIGVKGPNGGPVKVSGGVLETAPEFGMTVNAAPGADRIGSAGHQAQVNMGAQHGETYVSETGGALKPGALKDHVATMDHAKKAMHGLEKPPEALVGGAPEGQAMAKGALKAANQAGLDPEMVKTIAKQNGIKNPENILDKLAEIKTGRSTITSADEAAKLQKTTRDILNAAEAKTKAAAATEVQAKQTQIAEMEAKGLKTQAQQARNELADYNAKARATTETIRGPTEPVTKPGGSKPGVTVEPEPKVTGGRKLISGAGLILGIYGIYEGYHKAKEEMEAKKQAEPQGVLGWSKEKAELAARTFWHGLGFGTMAEIGGKAGKEAYDQYQKDIKEGKVSPDSWTSYLVMKGKAVLGGLYGAGKALTYDAAKQSAMNVKDAAVEGGGAAKGLFDALKSARDEKRINEERSKEVYDKLIKNGASPVGAKIAADGVLKGDFTEAKRLNKILEGKQAAKLAAAEQSSPKTRTWRDRKKAEMRKEATKQTAKTAKAGTEDEQKLLDLVIARLRAANLPVNDNLVNRCLTALKDGGEKALAEVIKEFTSMEGTFAGRATMPDNTHATLTITIKSGRVTGTFSQSTSQNLGAVTASRRISATVTGRMDMASGAIEMQASGTIVGSAKSKGSSKTTSMEGSWLFRGSYNGNGYKGSTEIPWSVSH